jgi:hypothetical protein
MTNVQDVLETGFLTRFCVPESNDSLADSIGQLQNAHDHTGAGMKRMTLMCALLLSACASREDAAIQAAGHAAAVGDQARQEAIEASREELARHRAEAEAMDAHPQRAAREALGEE